MLWSQGELPKGLCRTENRCRSENDEKDVKSAKIDTSGMTNRYRNYNYENDAQSAQIETKSTKNRYSH